MLIVTLPKRIRVGSRVSALPTVVLLLVLALGAATPSLAADPAVARPSFEIKGRTLTQGTVFFIGADNRAGAVAVGTAHAFDLRELVQLERGQLLLGNSKQLVATTRGFLVPPGQPMNTPGATLLDDYVVYTLDAPPIGVRRLELSNGAIEPGERVRLLGVPSGGAHDEDDLFGRVVEVSTTRITVDLDVPHDLKGWGGAPVISDARRQVVGILQATSPQSPSQVIASPITALRAALKSPLDDGKGRPFAAFEEQVRRAARASEQATPRARTAKGRSASRQEKIPPFRPLIKQQTEPTRVHLEIEYPPEGAVMSDTACGVFVAGRAIAHDGDLQLFDVMLVIDTSRSTVEPTGADINGNGIVGKPSLGPIGAMFNLGSTDPGDTILAAEVAAARQLLRGLDPRSTRVGVAVFAGQPPGASSGIFNRSPRPPAMTLQALTSDYSRVSRVLDNILSRDPDGATHMAAGIDQATIELMGLRGAQSDTHPKSEKVVLFFTDGQPTLPYGPGFERDNVKAVLRAANRAHRAQIRIHSFAIGPDALDGPIAPVEMAQRTGGYFTPVRHPADLINVVEEVSFANLEGISVRSITTDTEAQSFRTTADGSWSAFVKMEPGENYVEVNARANDGTEVTRRVAVHFDRNAESPGVPPELVVQRNWLLEECLREIKQLRLVAERDATEQVRKNLLVEIERERLKARERAEEQRKSLHLEVEEPPE